MKKAEELEMTSKETKIVETENFEKIDLSIRGFYLYGKKGDYNLCFAGAIVWPNNVINIKEAEKLVKEKPWDLIFITCSRYIDLVNKQRELATKNK